MPYPNPSKMYGITHDPNTDQAVVRVPKLVKVQIGHAKGPDIAVWIDLANNWNIVYNRTHLADGKVVRAYSGPNKADAIKIYNDLAKSCATGKVPELITNAPVVKERKYPGKLPYFTFSRMTGEGLYEPEWDLIESHGHCPTEIEIVFTDDAPFRSQYQMWTKTELQCSGDGLNAIRLVTLGGSTPVQVAHAKAAAAANQRHFLIEDACWVTGCPYANAKNGCKPHGQLQFQLLSSLRLGGVAQLDTTSVKSVSQLFSCIHQFMVFTGNGNPERGFIAGIPLNLILRPFPTKHGKAYAVALEFKADSIEAMRQKIIAAGKTFRQVMQLEEAPKQLAAPTVAPGPMAAEFLELDDDDETPIVAAGSMAQAAANQAAALAAKLQQAKAPAPAPAAAPFEAQEVVETDHAGEPDGDGEIEGEANEQHPDVTKPAQGGTVMPTKEEMDQALKAQLAAEAAKLQNVRKK